MSKRVCNMDCLNCEFSDCVNNSNNLSDSEVSFSVDFENSIKKERRQEEIRQIDDPKARAVAKYRQTPKGKEMLHRRNTSENGKERFRRYEKTDKAKERRKRHEAKPERIAYRKAYMKEYNKRYYAERKRKEKENADNQVQQTIHCGSNE